MDARNAYTKAAAHFELKAVDNEARVLSGIATTPAPDRAQDVVNPMGAKWSLPLPLLYAHDHKAPVGKVETANASPKGIAFTARISNPSTPGILKDRCDLAWHEVREGLVNSVSIGFRALEAKPIAGGGLLFDSWDWYELSLCVVPMNAQALITSRRSLDLFAASQTRPTRVVRLSDPLPGEVRGRVVRLKD